MKQHHWFWLSAICLVGGLVAVWTDDIPVKKVEIPSTHLSSDQEPLRRFSSLGSPDHEIPKSPPLRSPILAEWHHLNAEHVVDSTDSFRSFKTTETTSLSRLVEETSEPAFVMSTSAPLDIPELPQRNTESTEPASVPALQLPTSRFSGFPAEKKIVAPTPQQAASTTESIRINGVPQNSSSVMQTEYVDHPANNSLPQIRPASSQRKQTSAEAAAWLTGKIED